MNQYKGFNDVKFRKWLREERQIEDGVALTLVNNIIFYADKHKNVSKDQFAYFVSDMLQPLVTFLEVSRFCENNILTDGTLKELGRS